MRRRRARGAAAALAALALTAGCDSTGPEAPPAPPAAIAALPASDQRITLTWALPDDDVSAIVVERSEDGGPFLPVTTLEGPITSLTDAGLDPATTYRYRLRACNRAGCSTFGVEASATTFPSLSLTTTVLPAAVVGATYEASLNAVGGNGHLTYAVTGGSLPPGIALAANGTLSGTPTAPGAFAFTVSATTSDGQSSSADLEIVVRDVLVITTDVLPGGVVGRAYSAAVGAEGGDSTYTWFVEAGALPAGLALSDRGIVSGTPDTEQTSRFTARVRSGDDQTAVRELSITIGGDGPVGVSIRTALLPPAIAGLRYNPQLRAAVSGGAALTWSLAAGSLPPGVRLNPNGTLSGVPTTPGSYTFTARVTAGSESATSALTVRVDPNDTGRYNVTRFDVAPVPPAIAPHVDAAFARWERVIVGDLTIDSIPRDFFGGSSCGGFGDEANGTGIDDVLVMVNIDSIDGAGDVLGQAGPCAFHEDDDLTGIGVLTLDAADLESLVGSRTLTDIIFHEIGHILGAGTLWDGFGCRPGTPRCLNYVEGEGGEDPTFTGPAAVREWHALGGTGNVPIENEGGEGTRLSHWRESIFDHEIMTGFVERRDALNPLSRVTIASFADLGYRVSYADADPYTLPRTGALRAPGPEQARWELPLDEPPRRLGPADGSR